MTGYESGKKQAEHSREGRRSLHTMESLHKVIKELTEKHKAHEKKEHTILKELKSKNDQAKEILKGEWKHKGVKETLKPTNRAEHAAKNKIAAARERSAKIDAYIKASGKRNF